MKIYNVTKTELCIIDGLSQGMLVKEAAYFASQRTGVFITDKAAQIQIDKIKHRLGLKSVNQMMFELGLGLKVLRLNEGNNSLKLSEFCSNLQNTEER